MARGEREKDPEYFGNVDSREQAMRDEVARIRHYSERIFNPYTSSFLAECRGGGLDLQGKTLLTLGIGPGSTLPVWVEHELGEIIGVDTNSFMLQAAGEKAQELGIGERFRPLEAKVEQMDGVIPGGSVDLVEARLLWQHIPLPAHEAMISKVKTVLKPGGGVFFEDLILDTWVVDPGCGSFDDIMRAGREFYARRNTNWDMGDSLRQLCEQSGLTVVNEDEYFASSEGNAEVKKANLWILKSMGRGITAVGIMTQEEFGRELEEVDRHTSNLQVVVKSPVMKQVYAVKQ